MDPPSYRPTGRCGEVAVPGRLGAGGSSMHPHVQAISNIYAAFGRQDIPAILAELAEDVEWEYGPNSTDVPWLQHRRGHAGAAEFFGVLGHEFEFRKFEINGL